MALIVGLRLGPYEIISALGAGGMGEVYRARDTTLNRDVAIKVLPDVFASDAERLARFTREAQTLASLNHPNIAHIHGLEESNGVRALVMELVDGEDLSQRLARGAIPLDEALPIARQIAEALEAAHERGIIHRDLKPANIKVRPDGTVKVLDFGLAKLAGAEKSREAGRDLTHSPTITSPAMMTGAGIILGTAAYMSPEQARGKLVDKRADIWAFGVVLFEMLTGPRLFAGETISDTLASVLKTDPNWRVLPPTVSPRLRALLRRCLEKDPRRRLRDIGEARVQLEDLIAGTAEEPQAGGESAVAARPLWRRAAPWAVAGALAIAFATVAGLWAPWRKTTPPAPLRLSVELGADAALGVGARNAISLSPDGTVLAFVATRSGGVSPQLYVRRLTELQAAPLSGTDDADGPFFSADGRWIGFFAGGKLKKISVTGGAAVTLCDAPNGRGGAWAEDDTIVFVPNAGGSLMRVSAAGGTPQPLTSLAENETTQRWPQVLPGGKAVLYTASDNIGVFSNANVVVQALPAGPRTVVQRGGYHGRYMPSGGGFPTGAVGEGGHLVYIHEGTLFAVPFDPDRLVVTGPPVPALEGLASNATTGAAHFAASASGTLVYLAGQTLEGGSPIHWMEQQGKTTPLRPTAAAWTNLRFAPEGRRLAFQIQEGSSIDIWVYEWARDAMTKLTSDPTPDMQPAWTPDGRRIVFASGRAPPSTMNLYWQRADGTGDAQRLTVSSNPQRAGSWHPSGKFLAFEERQSATNWDLMILPMDGDESSGWKAGKPTKFLTVPAREVHPMFSPDGRWLAYVSSESGSAEVQVRPFAGPDATPGGKWLISTGGGSYPTWSRTKDELLYRAPNGEIMVVPFTVEGGEFRAERPRSWSGAGVVMRGIGAARMFDLHPDGKRVALALPARAPETKQDKVTFISNFFDELRRIAPPAKR